MTEQLTLRWLFVDYPHVTFGAVILVYATACAWRTRQNAMTGAALLAMYAATIYGATSMGIDAVMKTNAQLGAAGWSQVVAFFMLLAYAAPNTIEIIVQMWRGADVEAKPPAAGASISAEASTNDDPK